MIDSFFLFEMTYWLYFLGAILYIVYTIFGKFQTDKLVTASGAVFGGNLEKGDKTYFIGKLAIIITIMGWCANTGTLILRTIESGHAPYASLYESMILLAWAIVLGYIFIEFAYKLKIIGGIIVSIGFLTMLVASILPYRYQNVEGLNPALQSNWLIVHVFVTFIGYAGFAIACGLSVLYLIMENREEQDKTFFSRFPDKYKLDELSYRAIAFGFPFLTLGIITGAIWARYAWGTYWSWDPKETWSLIAWFIYAGYLHARMTTGWRGRRTAWFSIIGFLSILFLYWGVSFILPGLHAYA